MLACLLHSRGRRSQENRVADNRIFRHPKRPEWGMAVMREQIDDRILFAFEDAQVRAFKANLLNVLEIVHLPDDESASVLAKLQKKASTRRAVKKKAPTKAAKASAAEKVSSSSSSSD
jgi:hypothetical protein